LVGLDQISRRLCPGRIGLRRNDDEVGIEAFECRFVAGDAISVGGPISLRAQALEVAARIRLGSSLSPIISPETSWGESVVLTSSLP